MLEPDVRRPRYTFSWSSAHSHPHSVPEIFTLVWGSIAQNDHWPEIQLSSSLFIHRLLQSRLPLGSSQKPRTWTRNSGRKNSHITGRNGTSLIAGDPPADDHPSKGKGKIRERDGQKGKKEQRPTFSGWSDIIRSLELKTAFGNCS